MGALDLLLEIRILILALPKFNSGACLPPSCLLGLWGSHSISDDFPAIVHVGCECTIPLRFCAFFVGGAGGGGGREYWAASWSFHFFPPKFPNFPNRQLMDAIIVQLPIVYYVDVLLVVIVFYSLAQFFKYFLQMVVAQVKKR